MSEKKNKGLKWDGKSRVSNNNYRKNWNEIFKKNLEGTVINIGESFLSDDFLDQAEREKKELEESYQESRRQTEERKAKERLTGPIDSFSEDLQNSIKESRRQTKKRKNFHAKAIDGYSE